MIRTIDFQLSAAVLLLIVIGTTILFSVQQQLFPLQFLYITIAAFVFFVTTRADGIILRAIAPFLYVGVVVLLFLTLLVGIVSHGSVRWLPIGPFTFQPSEFAKPILALITAWAAVHRDTNLVIRSIALLFVPALLTFVQPDLTTTIILVSVWIGAIMFSAVSSKSLLRLSIVAFVVIPISWFLLAPYQKERITSFIDPTGDPSGVSYQSRQAMIAAGSGGLFGRGLGQGSQTQLAFLPERATDFAFASIGEELGFLGMFLVLLGFFVLFTKILKFINRTTNTFSKAALGGIFVYLFTQTFINIAMNLGIIPIAGVPLPMISAGGSALVSTLFALGIVVALRK